MVCQFLSVYLPCIKQFGLPVSLSLPSLYQAVWSASFSQFTFLVSSSLVCQFLSVYLPCIKQFGLFLLVVQFGLFLLVVQFGLFLLVVQFGLLVVQFGLFLLVVQFGLFLLVVQFGLFLLVVQFGQFLLVVQFGLSVWSVCCPVCDVIQAFTIETRPARCGRERKDHTESEADTEARL